MLLRIFLALGAAFPVLASSSTSYSPPDQTKMGITLLEKLDNSGGGGDIAYSGNTLFNYISDSLEWIQKVAVGVVILWMLFSGVMYMISGNDQGKRSQAKDHIISAIIGLLMLFLLGFLLSLLNASFYQQ